MRGRIFLQIMLMVACTYGCATHAYRTEFHTYLLQSDPQSLQFRDDKFTFVFTPVPNGVFFSIENSSQAPAFLVWDRCYFIEPGGNSSKALNVDLLEENAATRDKANYESIIPPNGIFSRFTTSALNIDEFSSLRSYQITKYSSGIATAYSYAEIHKFCSFGRYWPDFQSTVKDSAFYDHHMVRNVVVMKERGFANISSYVIDNDRMGVGLCIRLNEQLHDYRFDFRFDKIEVYEIDSKKERLIGVATRTDSWKWTLLK